MNDATGPRYDHRPDRTDTDGSGVAGASSSDSLCSNTLWQITAESSSASSGAKMTVTQGVGIRVSVDDMASSCL